MHSPSDSRVLFNERSNRLEPYSSVHSHHRQGTTGQPSYLARRGSRSEHGGSPVESRGGRDIPPHVHQDSVQLLQKAPGHLESRPDAARYPGDHAPSGHPEGPPYRHHDRDSYRNEQVPAAFARTHSQGSHGRAQDHVSSYDMGAFRSPRDAPKELSRQLPPHLSVLPSPHAPRSPLLPNVHWRETSGLAAEPPPERSQLPITSPDVHHAASSPTMPTESLASTSGGPVIDLTETQKKEMHSAAERARLRRQQEEQEREQEKERARRKAAELEARLIAKDAGKPSEAPEPLPATDGQVCSMNVYNYWRSDGLVGCRVYRGRSSRHSFRRECTRVRFSIYACTTPRQTSLPQRCPTTRSGAQDDL